MEEKKYLGIGRSDFIFLAALFFGTILFCLIAPFIDGVDASPSKGFNLVEVGSDFERFYNKETGEYRVTLHSNLVYYPENGGTFFDKWEKIDENFYSENCFSNKYQNCQKKTNYYKAHLKNDPSLGDFISFEVKNEFLFLDFGHIKINGQSINLKPHSTETKGNQQTYIFQPGKYWATYTYTPDMLKEEIFINDSKLGKKDKIEIQFQKKNSNQYALIGKEFTVCDYSGYYCDVFNISKNGDLFIISFEEIEWIENKDVEFPIVVDPVIQLSYVNVTWDGEVHRTFAMGDLWVRKDSTATGNALQIGHNSRAGHASPDIKHRAAIDYNFSLSFSNPDEFYVTDMRLYTHITGAPSNTWGADIFLNISHMDGNNDTYLMTEAGDQSFHTDMENGTTYNYSNVTGIAASDWIVLLDEAAWRDFEQKVQDSEDWFSLGFRINPEAKPGPADQITYMKIAARNFATVSERHYLNITYKLMCDEPDPEGRWWINTTCVFDGEDINSCDSWWDLDESAEVHITGNSNISLDHIQINHDIDTDRVIISSGRIDSC